MTREEAKGNLIHAIRWNDIPKKEALEMAVKALEQEPCPNAISRSDMLDAVGHGTTYTSEELQKIIKALPPVNPQANKEDIHREREQAYMLGYEDGSRKYRTAQSEDTISRQWLMECVNEGWIKFDTEKDENRFIHLIRDIAPPVTPQPCDNVISRQAVLDIVDSYSESQSNVEDVTQDIISDIVALSPVNPQSKMGRWRHYEGVLRCSECGAEFYDDIMEYCGDDAPKWCPDCGTKMIEPQESEE